MFKKKTLSATILVLACALLFTPLLSSNVQAEDKKTLNVLLPIGGGYTIEDQKAIGNQFEEKRPDVDVKMQFVGWANLFDTIVTSIGAGDAPDAMYIGSRWIPQLANLGAIKPLGDYASEEKLEMYPQPVMDTVTYQGKIYGIVKSMSSKALIYNKELFRKAGLDPESPPKTWDELYNYAEKIDSLGKDVYGFGLAGKKFTSTTSQFLNFLYSNGGRVVNAEGKVTLAAPEAIEALEFYTEKLPKVSEPSPMEWKRENLIKPFKAGKVGMYIDHVHSAAKALDAGIDVGVALIPGGPAEGAPEHATVQVTDSIAIPTQSDHPDLAWEFIKFMTSYEQQLKWDKRLGFIPPIEKEMEDEFFQSKWYWKPYLEATRKYAVGQPKLKNYTAGEEIILNAIQKAFLGRATPEQALKGAASSIRSMEG